MKKSDVETHSNRGPSHPAVNVKAYKFPSLSKTQERFKCCEATAQKALEIAYQSQCENFWEDVAGTVEHFFGAKAKFYSEGRQSGWLVVHNLAELESWDAIQLSKWAAFEKAVKREVNWLCSEECVFELIEISEWAPADALLDDGEAESEEAHEMACRDIKTS